MALIIRQSTEITAKIGPFLDATDGVTEETGLAAGGTEISKNGGAYATGPVLGTHDAEGWYPITLTATHTDTVGRLRVKSQNAATHLPVWIELQVVEEAIYDAMFASGATAPATASALATVDSNVDAILLDTAEIGTAGAGLTEAGGTGDHLTAIVWNAAWDAEVQSEVADALNAYDPPTNTEMVAAFTEIKGASWATTDTLEAIRDRGDAAWVTATGFSTLDAAGVRTAIGLASANLDTQIGTLSTHSAADVWTAVTRTLTAGTNLNDLSEAQVNAQVDAAIETYHLDHLFAVDYDPASKPGVATALLNELIESNAGVSRYTAAALAQAPSGGGGGDATEANQTTIINHLTDIKGGTWATTDSLEAIRNQGDAAWLTATASIVTSGLTTQGYTTARAAKLDNLDAAISGVGGAVGAGADTVTLTLNDGAGLPIADADVWITTDSAGSNVVAGTLQTNSLGKATFQLDAGVAYYRWAQKDGFSFTNPQLFTAVAD